MCKKHFHDAKSSGMYSRANQFPQSISPTSKKCSPHFFLSPSCTRGRKEQKRKRGHPNSKFGEGIGKHDRKANNRVPALVTVSDTPLSKQIMTWQHQTRRSGLVVAVFICAVCFGHRWGSLPEVELLDRYIFCETQTLKCML